jgi:hypothetical protein
MGLYYKKNKRFYKEDDMFSTLDIFVIGSLVLGFILIVWQLNLHPSRYEQIKGQSDCRTCHSPKPNAKMVEYFRKKGSRSPEEMANAVYTTNSPRLLAAIAVRETGANHTVKRTGYKKRHYGAFQVNPKDWGKVSNDPIQQALQAEAILKELTQETGDIKKALNAYGGDKTRKVYAANILKELQEVPR